MSEELSNVNEEPNEEAKTEDAPQQEPKEEPKEEKQEITSLKVKADSPDVSPEERKRKVKKLAGAISHSLRGRGEINVRCFGNASIGKATKALAIAKDYIKVASASVGSDKPLQLQCSPGFITTKIGDNELTGICFWTFASEPNSKEVDLDKVKTVLMVKSDPRDIEAEERKIRVKKLAGAITHALEENKEVVIRCFGNATIGKATKALAIARGHTATRGPDLYCWPNFIVAEINGNERTGIAFYAYTNEL
jgi:stage V sporulation protein SpoVS